MTDYAGHQATEPNRPSGGLALHRRLSLDTWAVLAAALFIVLIVAGVLPKVPW